MIILPSVLAADYMNLERDMKKLENSCAEWIHYDIMDGNFVDNISFGLDFYKKMSKLTTKKKDVHLMVNNPQKYIDKLIDIGVDLVTIHSEILDNIDYKDIILKCKKEDILVGIAFNPSTDIAQYEKILKEFDLVLIMSVNPGAGGQKFIPTILDKIDFVNKYNQTLDTKLIIEIDGGINDETIKYIQNKNINFVVSGSFLFSGDIDENIKRLQ